MDVISTILNSALNSSAGSMVEAQKPSHFTIPGVFVASIDVPEPVNSLKVEMPKFTDPCEIGNYSLVGEKRECVDGTEQLKYLQMPRNPKNLSWDLNPGYEEAVRLDRSVHERLDNLLHWILRNKDKLALDQASEPAEELPRKERQRLRADFVCHRGALLRLACTPYDKWREWLLVACCFRGTIYLCAFETEDERNERIRQAMHTKESKREDLVRFWGYKFLQYVVSDEPGASPDVDAVVHEGDSYCVVVRRQLGSHTLVFDAEVSAIDPNVRDSERHQEGSMAAYVELKTSRISNTANQRRNFRQHKLLKWWMRSFLAGIPRVLCGFRNDEGTVSKLDEFTLDEIVRQAKSSWSGEVCMQYCDLLLSSIKKHVKEDNPGVVYLFYYEKPSLSSSSSSSGPSSSSRRPSSSSPPPSRRVVCKRLVEPGEYFVLPEWYLQAFDTP